MRDGRAGLDSGFDQKCGCGVPGMDVHSGVDPIARGEDIFTAMKSVYVEACFAGNPMFVLHTQARGIRPHLFLASA